MESVEVCRKLYTSRSRSLLPHPIFSIGHLDRCFRGNYRSRQIFIGPADRTDGFRQLWVSRGVLIKTTSLVELCAARSNLLGCEKANFTINFWSRNQMRSFKQYIGARFLLFLIYHLNVHFQLQIPKNPIDR